MLSIVHLLLIVSFLLLVGMLSYKLVAKKQIRRREIIERLSKECNSANKAFETLTKFEKGYFSNYQMQIWRTTYSSLFKESSKQFKRKRTDPIIQFLTYYLECSKIRDAFNRDFITKELDNYSIFFDQIEGRKLDKQQRVSIITDDDNNIVVAGAGSGKTTTIIGKVNYVIDRYCIPPNEILLISFTDKSASTLAKRINIEGIEAKTFHKFGLDVISEVEGEKPSIFDVNQFKHLLSRFIKEEFSDQEYLQKFTKYFTEYLKIPRSQDDFTSQGEYFQYLKDQNFSAYNAIRSETNGTVTYKKQVVKSIEECKIANFLFFNNVNYEYEQPYEIRTATTIHSQYKPDFTITQDDRKIYLEHFALNNNGVVPPFFADRAQISHEEATQKYIDGIQWKRNVHAENETKLIETYSYEMHDGSLFDNLTHKLNNLNIVLTPKSPEEIWTIISSVAEEEIKSFIDLLATFITLTKSNNYSIEAIIAKNTKVSEKFMAERNGLFIDIFTTIFRRYENELKLRREIDFNDMINKASFYISNKDFTSPYRYVIIDEFQDISVGRYGLVKSLKNANPVCKLFCVGDDWQSIYRFTGSDISLYKNFEDYFGFTVKSKIETTYRFHNPLIDLSSGFILKNSNQSVKKLISASSNKETTYKIVYSTSKNQDDTLALKNIFDSIISESRSNKNCEIQILGRYSFDLANRIKNEDGIFMIDQKEGSVNYSSRGPAGQVVNLSAKFMTIHKAKGLEADHVIVINCNSGKFGLPSEKSDDPILNLLLSESDQFENGEERRLFYVAMTRARKSVHFIADSYNQSKFITEIDGGNIHEDVKKCPFCNTANQVYIQGISSRGRNWAFWGCSNYRYGCKFQEWVN